MSIAFKFHDELSSTHCCVCGVHFAFPTSLMDDLRRRHTSFHCPNGHSQSFIAKTETEKKLEQATADLAREKQRREMAEREAKSESRRAKRIERRIQNGVCTCCNRTFANLARHMKTKHPEIAK